MGSEEAARYLGMSRSSLRRSTIPFVSTPGGSDRGGRRRYRVADLDAWLARQGSTRLGLAERVMHLERRMDAVEGRLGAQARPPLRTPTTD